jgi:Raf kinase inhibitor-like YbhB/YbcL family protein
MARPTVPRGPLSTVAALAVAAAAAVAGCGGGSGDKVSSAPAASTPARLRITSADFAANGTIPTRFTCAGAGDRPALRFGGIPRRAREVALLVIDPDAGGFVHWTVYGMAAGVRGIGATGLPSGAREGRNSTGGTGWTPPCPPSGLHRYEFELYWLRAPSKLAAGADAQKVVAAIRAKAGGRGELVGRFGKS